MKFIVAVIFILMANLCFAKPASNSIYLYDQSVNKAIVAENSTEIRPIASISKLMTAIVALDYSTDMNRQLKVSNKIVSYLPSKEHSRLDVLSAMLIRSDNAAAETIAADYPGGREAFMRAMNQKAIDLGMTNTRFHDPSGLSVFNVSTAEEVAVMVNEASKYELIRTLTTTQEKTFETQYKKRIKTITLINTNRPVLIEFASIIASKTGLTSAAGWCIGMAIENNGHKYLVVVLGSKTKTARLRTVEQNVYNHILVKE